MHLNIYEIFEKFKEQKNEKQRIDLLRQYKSHTLCAVLQAAFDPKIKFTVSKTPEYKKEITPIGMSISSMPMAIKKLYLWMENHAARPNLTKAKEEILLIQLLESLEPREAVVWMDMMKKDLKVPYLTVGLVNKTFPGLIPK